MAPLVEVHSAPELQTALTCQPHLIGINNRDLHDFSVRLETTIELRSTIPPGVLVVSESGIHNLDDIQRLESVGVDAILVGEAIVTSDDPSAQVRRLAQVEIQP
jgi:indole-3-glycerol phosphate synthase